MIQYPIIHDLDHLFISPQVEKEWLQLFPAMLRQIKKEFPDSESLDIGDEFIRENSPGVSELVAQVTDGKKTMEIKLPLPAGSWQRILRYGQTKMKEDFSPQMKGKQKFRAYIDPMIEEQVSQLYNGDKNDGVNSICNFYLALRKVIIREIKQAGFTREEIIGVIDTFNGTMIDYSLTNPRDLLRIEMEDSIALEYSDERHGYDGDAFMGKVNQLSNIQAAILIEEVCRFWKVENRDLEEFVKALV